MTLRRPPCAAVLPAPILPDLRPALGATLDRALWRAPQAEWGLALQGAAVLLSRDQSQGWLVREASGTLAALGRPLGLPDLAGLVAAAGQRRPLLYKCDARTATVARRAGWATLPIGHEAVLDLATWSVDRPACRQLRRKLRAAARVVRVSLEEAPVADLADVAAAWCARHGGERGFSMGRFSEALLRRQRVVVARDQGRVVAFASFFASREEWSLDLLRHAEDLADGTMHALVAHAGACAAASGARRLSLAAIPDPRRAALKVLGLACRPTVDGLAQFKRSFGPRVRPLYAAAPRRADLVLGLAAVALAVRRPPPLAEGCGDAKKGFEPPVGPCDAQGRRPSPGPVPFRGAAGR